jgi:hypothetical protein
VEVVLELLLEVLDPSPGSVDDVVESPGNVLLVVVVESSVRTRLGLRTLPGNLVGALNDPVCIPSVALRMNLFQICAGNEPPVTSMP